ncbi:putative chromatin regulator PHD family [Helianthus anomalus]
MARGNGIGVKGSGRRRVQKRENDSDEEYRATEEEDCDESDEFYTLDGEESEEILADFGESRRVSRSRNIRRTSSSKKVNGIMKPRKRRKVVYTENDDDDDDDEVVDEKAAEFMSLGRQVNQKKNPTAKETVSYTNDNDGDGDYVDEEDYAEFVSSGRKRNQRRKPLVYTDDEDDDDGEFMYSGRKVNHKKTLREKRKVSYAEDDDDDDSGRMYPSRTGNEIKGRRKRTDSYKEEEEDENDAEFELSERDFIDEEDETPKLKKNDKVSRYYPQKKSDRGGHKKCKNSKLKNPVRRNQIDHRSSQKLGSSKERSVKNKTQIKNRKKKTSRRKRREMVESDSDFVNSASSDHEYTISEEEREQMREARVYCAGFRNKLRRSLCGNQEHHSAYEQRKYPLRKGKEKIADKKDEVGNQVCGICLSEERKRTVRGVLNCCQHYFCFSCIMEWSKVESRCPLCKQRFATITKAAKSDTGFDSRSAVIHVPECDQVYEPSEEELRGYLDPYESVICSECHNGGDDALMLLCDICDSSAHTFCVGLGREVPEGNWYCEGCRPTVIGTVNSQRPTPNSNTGLSSNTSDLLSPVVGGFDLNELYVPETPLTQQTHVRPEPVSATIGNVATTLRDRRRTHRQIHHHFLNNNRVSDLVGRSSGTSTSSSGVRLFGTQLDHIFPSQNSDLARVDVSLQDEHGGFGMGMGMGMGFDSRLEYAQLHPCTNRSNMMVDACREASIVYLEILNL